MAILTKRNLTKPTQLKTQLAATEWLSIIKEKETGYVILSLEGGKYKDVRYELRLSDIEAGTLRARLEM